MVRSRWPTRMFQRPRKKEHIAKANEHFKKGRAKEAIEELRLGEINVSYTRVMMPLTATKKCLADAMQLAKEHKYYEANLSLKAAEDGLILDSVGLAEYIRSNQRTKPRRARRLTKTERRRSNTLVVGETRVDGPWMNAEAIDRCSFGLAVDGNPGI